MSGVQSLRLTPEELRARLARLEQRYGLSSEEFLRRDARGELGALEDSDDAFEWYGLCYLAIADGILKPPSGWPDWPDWPDWTDWPDQEHADGEPGG